MDEALQALVATLLQLALTQLSGPAPPQLSAPVVQFVPQQEIARNVCGRPCAVRAYYSPEQGVLLDAQLDPLGDVLARSILFHEVVHHVQHHINRYADLPECERYRFREREAYALQNRYLMEQQMFVHFGGGSPVVRRGC